MRPSLSATEAARKDAERSNRTMFEDELMCDYKLMKHPTRDTVILI